MARKRTKQKSVLIRLSAGLMATALIGASLLVLYGGVTSQVSRLADTAIQNGRSVADQVKSDQGDRARVTEFDRMNSMWGRDLLRRCDEFTEFNEDHPGDYAREQRDEACVRYETFVRTGRVR